MARHSSSEKSSSRLQQQQHQQYSNKQQIPLGSAPSRSRQTIELQQQQQRASLKAKFGVNASQLRLTVFIVLTVALVLIGIAFFSTSWLEAEQGYYGAKFKGLGLWRMCFNSFSAPNDFQSQKFYTGCQWVFADEYKPIRKFLLPAFFITTQALYTAGFLLLVLVCAGILTVQQCFIIEREDYAFRALSVASLLSAISCTSAVTIFAIYGNEDDWMPDSEHNYLSWSFAAALIGSFLLWIAALLFYIEMQLARTSSRRNFEQQQQQRTTLRSKFKVIESQLRLTIFVVLAVALVLSVIAFFSTNWLEVEQRFYGAKFKKLGLWRMCFNSFSAPDDFQFRKFYVGCRWVFADEYKPIRKFLLPAFFITTEILYTIGFLILLLVCAGILAVHQCFIIEREDHAFRALSFASLLSAISSTSAVTLFATYGNRDDWMPDSEHNYLSWSFAAALVGSFLVWIAALLLYIEMQLIIRRGSRHGSHSQASR